MSCWHYLAVVIRALALFVVVINPVSASDIDWEGWSFNWSTNNQSSGLVLSDVAYKGEAILGRASLPVMRVEYANNVCGPYADILATSVLEPSDNGTPNSLCDGQSFCTREFTRGSERFLEIGSNWQIGEYQIYQTYYFSEQGYFDARVYSRGLQCEVDHRHHPHWMFDFDINGRENDVIYSDDVEQAVEFNDLKANTSQWRIKDKNSSTEVLIIPAADDGDPSEFSQWDLAARAYNAAEIGRWRNGASADIGELFNEQESLDGKDLVVWYVAHLAHSAAEGADLWHASGPRIQVISDQSIALAAANPESESVLTSDVEAVENNLLVNGSFEQGQSGWIECGEPQHTEPSSDSASNGVGSITISNGGCLYQEFEVAPAEVFTLSCDAQQKGDQWTIMEMSFSDRENAVLSTNTLQIDSVGEYSTQYKTAIAPDNAEHAVVLLYSEDETHFDHCILQPGNSTPVLDDSVEGNILVNGDFEQGLSGWQSCAANSLAAVSGEALSGQYSLDVSSGGCVYQDFFFDAGKQYSLVCQVKKSGAAQTSLRLSSLTSAYETITYEETVVDEGGFQQYAASINSGADAAKGVAILYSENPAKFDSCVVTEI